MPGALVPALASSHAAPSTKLIDSARRSTPGAPHTHSSLPCRVADGHHAVAVHGGAAQHVVEQREDLRQRVRGAVLVEVGGVEHDGRELRVRVDAGGRRADPGLRDDRSHGVGELSVAHEGGVRPAPRVIGTRACCAGDHCASESRDAGSAK